MCCLSHSRYTSPHHCQAGGRQASSLQRLVLGPLVHEPLADAVQAGQLADVLLVVHALANMQVPHADADAQPPLVSSANSSLDFYSTWCFRMWLLVFCTCSCM